MKTQHVINIKKLTQNAFTKSKKVFETCEEIYTNKFIFEYGLDLEDISNLVFFTYKLDALFYI
jgi:hypothetical protein